MNEPASKHEFGHGGADQSALVFSVHQRLLQEIDIASLEPRSSEEARAAIESSVRALVADLADLAQNSFRHSLHLFLDQV